MIVTIRGKRWRLNFVPNLGRDEDGHEYYGKCDPPTALNKAIRVKRGLGQYAELETLVHEIIHAGQWDLSEQAVEEIGVDMTRALWRVGWRKVDG